MAQNRRWYKLDNIGTYYAAQAMTQDQTVFRFSATFNKPIKQSSLQAALFEILTYYPFFNVSLKNGLFWHYLEARDKPIFVEPEHIPICHPLHLQAEAPLLRVNYFENRINFEISHIVSDGRGSLMFFEDLLTAYCRHEYQLEVELPHGTLTTNAQKTEDSFLANYDHSLANSPPAPLPYHIKSAKSPDFTTYLEVHTETDCIIQAAKKIGVTVTSLLIGIVVKAIFNSARNKNVNKPIRIGVPVDLRDVYRSTTTRNFFGMTFLDIFPSSGDKSLSSLAKNVNKELRKATQPERLAARMNSMVKLEKSNLIKFAPSPLKDYCIRIGEWWTNKGVTSTVSNLGIAHLPKECEKYIKNINILTATKDLNFTAISFGNDFSLTISSVLVTQTVIARVLEELASLGKLDVNIAKSSNRRELPQLLPDKKNITLHYNVFPHNQLAAPRRIAVGILTTLTWLGFIALLVCAITLSWSAFIPTLACSGLWINFLFVRNIIRRSVGFVRAASRYFLVLFALCVLWYFTTQFPPVLEIALPILCLTGLSFDIILLLILHSNVVRDYAKYLFFDVILGFLPLFFGFLEFSAITPLAIISAAISGTLALVLLLFIPNNVLSEARKLFSTKK